MSITCEEMRGEGGREEGGEGKRGGISEGGDKWRGGTRGFILTCGTPRYHHGLAIVVHVGAISTGSIPSERATLKSNCAATVNRNCPSIVGSSIVDECDNDKDDVGVVHIQPSTIITTSISILYRQPLEGGRTAVVHDVHNALPSRTLPSTHPPILAAGNGRVLALQR